MCKLLGVRKIVTSAYRPNGNGGVERANQTMAQMLPMVCNERQDDWDIHLANMEFAHKTSVSAATESASNEVHMNRLSLFPHHLRTILRPRPPKPRPRPTGILQPRR